MAQKENLDKAKKKVQRCEDKLKAYTDEILQAHKESVKPSTGFGYEKDPRGYRLLHRQCALWKKKVDSCTRVLQALYPVHREEGTNWKSRAEEKEEQRCKHRMRPYLAEGSKPMKKASADGYGSSRCDRGEVQPGKSSESKPERMADRKFILEISKQNYNELTKQKRKSGPPCRERALKVSHAFEK